MGGGWGWVGVLIFFEWRVICLKREIYAEDFMSDIAKRKLHFVLFVIIVSY